MRTASESQRWGTSLAVIIASQAVVVLTLTLDQAFLPFYLAAELGVTDPDALKFWLGASAAAPPLMLVLVAPMWGAVADRYGQKPMMLRTVVAAAALLVALAAATQLWQFLLIRLLLGAFAGVNSATLAMVSVVVPRRRLATSIGWVQTGRFVGFTAGPALGGIVGDLLGYRGAFLAAGLAAFALAAAAFFLLPNPAPAAAGSQRQGLLAGFQYLGASRQLVALCAVILLAQCSLSAPLPFLPILVSQLAGGGNASSLSGLVVSAGSITSAVAGVVSGRLADRYGYVRLLVAGCAVGAVLQVLQASAQAPWQLIALRLGGGYAFGGLQPMANALAGLSVPARNRGLVFGVAASANAAGNLAGPLVGSVAAVAIGLPAPFLVAGVALVSAGLVTWRCVAEPRPEGDEGVPAPGVSLA